MSSGNHKQVVFGETGGVSAGSTGGPYSYHVKRLNNILTSTTTIPVVPYSLRNSTSYFPFPLSSVLDIVQSSKWNSNMIVATLYSSGYPTQNPYLYIPSTKEFSLEPVFYSGPIEGNEYRVYLNDMVGTKKIKGIVYTYYRNGPIILGGPDVSSNRAVYIDFPSPCSYVDLFWAANGSSTNPNGRIFWKTCDGSGGILEMTNRYAIEANPVPPISSR